MKKKIFLFLNGVAYPSYDGYRVRVGMKWQISDSIDLKNHWQLVKSCRVHDYRFPLIQFDKETHELIRVGEKVGTENHVRQFIPTGNIFIMR